MPNAMKRILFFLFLLIPGCLFAQNDSLPSVHSTDLTFSEPSGEVAPALTWNDRKEPLLAGFLSYIIPGAGQIYNKQYEKAFGVVAVMAYSIVMMDQASRVGNATIAISSGFAFTGAYVYSFVDAMLSAKKINRTIELQLTKNTSMSLKPDFQLTRKPMAFGVSGVEPVLGLRLKLSL